MGTVLYFVPHQDDEVLSMGVSIAQHVSSGEDVKVICCTDGSGSFVRTLLNDGGSCTKNINKTADNHNVDLSSGSSGGFVSARDREFKNACMKLGVKSSNIIIADQRMKDGYAKEHYSGAVKQLEDIISRYITSSAKVKCITPYGGDIQHLDHRALGDAVKIACEEVGVTDLRFYVEPSILSHYNGPNKYWKEQEEKNSDNGKKVIEAAKEYGNWRPGSPEYLYAIGWHSVYETFQECMGNTEKHDGKPTNYVHI